MGINEPRPLQELLRDAQELDRLRTRIKQEAGPSLRAARLSAGLSQNDLAEMKGVTQAYIANLEAGRKTPSPETITEVYGLIQEAEGRAHGGEEEGASSAKEDVQKARRGRKRNT